MLKKVDKKIKNDIDKLKYYIIISSLRLGFRTRSPA